ncbi:MAG: hypothetical protein WA057_03050 [Candidatus Magasanikiibacteriota bacterium]
MIRVSFEVDPKYRGQFSKIGTATERPTNAEEKSILAETSPRVDDSPDLTLAGEEKRLETGEKTREQKKLARERALELHGLIIELTTSEVFTSASDEIRGVVNRYLTEIQTMMNQKESIWLIKKLRPIVGEVKKCLEKIKLALQFNQKKPDTSENFARTLHLRLETIDPLVTDFDFMRKHTPAPEWGSDDLES